MNLNLRIVSCHNQRWFLISNHFRPWHCQHVEVPSMMMSFRWIVRVVLRFKITASASDSKEIDLFRGKMLKILAALVLGWKRSSKRIVGLLTTLHRWFHRESLSVRHNTRWAFDTAFPLGNFWKVITVSVLLTPVVGAVSESVVCRWFWGWKRKILLKIELLDRATNVDTLTWWRWFVVTLTWWLSVEKAFNLTFLTLTYRNYAHDRQTDRQRSRSVFIKCCSLNWIVEVEEQGFLT